MRADETRASRPGPSEQASSRRFLTAVEAFEECADLVGVWIVQVGGDRERFAPAGAGRFQALCVLEGEAQFGKGSGFGSSVLELSINVEGLLEIVDSIAELLKLTVDDAQATEACALSTAISDLTVNQQGLLVVVDGLVEPALVTVNEAEIDEGSTLALAVSYLSANSQAPLFVCGPAAGAQIQRPADRFHRCRLVGLNVSIVDEGAAGLFDVLIERDGCDGARPDLSLGASRALLPVVGVVRSHPQPEYGDRSGLDDAHAAIDRLLDRTAASVVEFDTRVDPRVVGIRSCAEIESLVTRMDIVITTRLHGLVLALRNGVPALAVDPIRGGAKVLAQARAVGWPAALACDAATNEALDAALAFCLEPAAASRAADCAARGAQRLAGLAAELRRTLGG